MEIIVRHYLELYGRAFLASAGNLPLSECMMLKDEKERGRYFAASMSPFTDLSE